MHLVSIGIPKSSVRPKILKQNSNMASYPILSYTPFLDKHTFDIDVFWAMCHHWYLHTHPRGQTRWRIDILQDGRWLPSNATVDAHGPLQMAFRQSEKRSISIDAKLVNEISCDSGWCFQPSVFLEVFISVMFETKQLLIDG